MKDAVISFPIFGENFKLNPKSYFTVFEKDIYWYGVIIAVGLILAYIYMSRRSRDFNLKSDDVIDILLYAVPIGVIGARLYYVVFYFSQFKADTIGETLYNIIAVWNGGLAIYGGVIFGTLGICLYSRIKKKSLLKILDLASFGVIIGQIVGRWGNFMNREAFGTITNVPWKMGLTTESGTVYVHPTFLYESLWNLIGLIIMHRVSKKHKKYDGQILLIYLSWYGLGRYFIEGLRTDSLYLFGTGVRVSQLLAVVLFGVASVLLVHNWLHGPRIRKAQLEPLCAETSAAAGEVGVILEDKAEIAESDEIEEPQSVIEKEPYIDREGYEYFDDISENTTEEKENENG